MAQTKINNKQLQADGWTLATDSWTYASATTITVDSGAAAIYSIGDKFKLTANSVVLYGYIIGIADTLLTVIGDALTNHAFSATYYSKAATPLGFPFYFQFTSTVTPGSGSFTTVSGTVDYFITGKEIFVEVYITITTNGTAASYIQCTLPIAPIRDTPMTGREMAVVGTLSNVKADNTLGAFILTATLTYPGGDGYELAAKGNYRYVA